LSAAALLDLNPAAASPQALLAIGNNRYFTAVDASATRLYRTVGAGAPQLMATFPPPASSPRVELADAVVVGSRAFLIADDGVHGREPWVINDAAGTVQLLRDINPGPLSGTPTVVTTALTALGSKVYFVADSGGADFELWSSDGITTSRVANINPGGPSTPSNLTPFGDRLYFAATSGSTRQLYRTNATGTGVQALGGSQPTDLTVAGGVLYFTSGPNRELHRVNAAGTGIQQLAAATAISQVDTLTALSDGLAFLGTAPGGQRMLGISQGSAATTALVDQPSLPAGSTPLTLIGVGSGVVQVLAHPTEGTDLWVHHAGTGSTEKLIDLSDAPADPAVFALKSRTTGGRAFFVTVDPASGGLLLGSTDGTPGGTHALGSIQPGGDLGQLDRMGLWAGVGGRLYFANRDALGLELWTSDGTVAGTQRVKDIQAGAGGSFPRRMVVQGSGIAFVASSQSGLNQIWTSAGTEATTQLATTLTEGGTATGQTSSSLADLTGPVQAVELGSSVVFFADDGVVGREPWISDGTVAGTRLVGDLNPAGSSQPLWLTPFNGVAYALVWPNNVVGEVWKLSGGANPGAERVGAIPMTGLQSQPVAFNGQLYFAIVDSSGYRLVRTSGVPGSGIETVAQFPRGSGVAVSLKQLAVAGDRLYFLTDDSVAGRRLWSTDGQTTTLLRSYPRLAMPTEIAVLGNRVFYQAGHAASGVELWSYNISTGTDTVHADINPGVGESRPSDLRVVGSTLYFGAETPSTGREIWRTTEAPGTFAAVTESLRPGPAGSITGTVNAVAAGGRLYVVANDGQRGDELLVIDQSSGATQFVDINPTPNASGLSTTETRFVVLGDAVFFNAIDGQRGMELWISDAAGTRLYGDLVPGTAGSAPQVLGRVGGGGMLVAASDPVLGRELFRVIPDSSNQPPTLAPIPDQTVDELQELVIPLIAADPDPGQTVTLSLTVGSLLGAVIDGNTFRWTPSEAQGDGSSYPFTIRATDSAIPAAFVERTFRVTVREVNQPPQLGSLPNPTITAGQTVAFTATASDADLPTQAISYSLVGAPAGAVIDPTTGAFVWTTSPSQPPGLYRFAVRATDSLGGSDERFVEITVLSSNRPPVINPFGSIQAVVGQTIQLAIGSVTSDPDPGQALVFSIISAPVLGNPPMIDPATGLLTWVPSVAQVATLTVRATDNGNPALSGDLSFQVQVLPPPSLLVGGVLVRVGRNLSGIQLRFSGPLEPAVARALGNYRLVAAGRDRRLGTRDDVVQRLRQAVYNPANNTVTLTAARAFSRTTLYRLTIGNLLDVFGRPISGQLTIQRNRVRLG
jgi:ELWxxDGT repeat protein